MAQKKKPRCFVAMAFNHSDTDIIYDQHIEPILKRNNIIPIIINRQQDNRDINNQIIEHLEKCDFCIADLTYTRPSVYYEAGYAQRNVEVIYTVRKDHLRKNQSEDRRVHFDLQMKPMIIWNDTNDKTFQSRLESRLKTTVLRKWNKQYEKELKSSAERDKFNSLPISDRLEIYRRCAINIAYRHNFKDWKLEGKPPNYYGDKHFYKKTYKNPNRYSKYNVFFIGEKKTNDIIKRITIISVEKVLVGFLQYGLIFPVFMPGSYILAKTNKDFKNLTKIEEHHLVLSPNKTPESRIRSGMPKFYKDTELDRYHVNTKYKFGEWGKQSTIIRKVYLYFPTSIDSENKIKEKLNEIISKI